MEKDSFREDLERFLGHGPDEAAVVSVETGLSSLGKSEIGPLLSALVHHSGSGPYPFHMPGHKRRSMWFPDPYSIDITEIDGFDDLHHPEGLIRELEERIARIYGVGHAIISVNGSTAGNLACIHAALPRRGLCAVSPERHRSTEHALLLREAAECRLGEWMAAAGDEEIACRSYPDEVTSYSGLIWSEDSSESPGSLGSGGYDGNCRAQDVCAVVITSPGYNGECYDIKKIADKCHERGIPLIVDAAHGAHFGFHPYFPENPAHLGADAVVLSLHKTLPAFTQTSCILIPEGSLISDSDIRIWMNVFETSSPSYILMAGIERCMDFLEKDGQRAFERYASRLQRLYEDARSWSRFRLRDHESYMGSRPCDDFGEPYAAVDPGKLVISADGLSGQEIAGILRSEYHIEPERVTPREVLLMTSVFD